MSRAVIISDHTGAHVDNVIKQGEVLTVGEVPKGAVDDVCILVVTVVVHLHVCRNKSTLAETNARFLQLTVNRCNRACGGARSTTVQRL